jgi:hypothetical protein
METSQIGFSNTDVPGPASAAPVVSPLSARGGFLFSTEHNIAIAGLSSWLC